MEGRKEGGKEGGKEEGVMVLQLMGSDQIVLKKGEEPVIFLLVPRPPPFPVPIPNSQNRFVNVMVSVRVGERLRFRSGRGC